MALNPHAGPAPRFHVDAAPPVGATVALPSGAARHVQVLRLRPGSPVRLFDGTGGEAAAVVETVGRGSVDVRVEAHLAVERELPFHVTLAVAMPANDRMDALVEKATELGAAAIVPLVAERSVLRLAGERAERRVAHWQAVAVAACEQCGRNRVPRVAPVAAFGEWLQGAAAEPADPAERRWLLTLGDGAGPPAAPNAPGRRVRVLSGPEGGLSAAERTAARDAGFAPVTLGPRVLRADTAPLAALAWLAIDALRGPDR